MILAWSLDSVGPICRSAEDCALVLDAIRGADGLDRSVIDAPFNFDATTDVTQLRLGYRAGVLDPATLERLASLVGEGHLREFTLPSTPVDVISILQAEAASAFEEVTRAGGDEFLVTATWSPTIRVGRTLPAVEYLQGQRLRQKLIQETAVAMQEIDVYVTTIAETNPSILVDLSNLTGQPCVVIPNGNGSHLGFVGRLFDEATLLALAKAYQDLTSFHKERPPGFLE
jgi:Asp-tRNA(Asn)/Glu-tRNA(Gln) amidotransferase A subunit family amidase